jgi:hypothetical protein
MKMNGQIENANSDAVFVLRDYYDGRDGTPAISPEMLYVTETLLTAVFEEVLNDPSLGRQDKTKNAALSLLWNFEDEQMPAQFAESSDVAQTLYALFMVLPIETRQMAEFFAIRALLIH